MSSSKECISSLLRIIKRWFSKKISLTKKKEKRKIRIQSRYYSSNNRIIDIEATIYTVILENCKSQATRLFDKVAVRP